MDFKALLDTERPTSTVEIGEFELPLRAMSAKAIDDLFTKYPSKNDDEFLSARMRYEMIAATVTDPGMDWKQVEELFDTWARPDVAALQDAVVRLNFSGSQEQAPLSETESEGTGGSR